MSGSVRSSMMSRTSSDSSDSSLLDPVYAVVVDSSQDLVSQTSKDGYRQGEKSPARRCSLAVVSLVMSVVTLVLLGACLLFLWQFVNSSMTQGLSEQERVCTPCSQIQPSPMEDDWAEDPALKKLSVHQGTDGERICCASTPAQYATFFKLILQRQEEVKNLADMLGSEGGEGQTAIAKNSTGAVSAHLLFRPPHPSSATPREHLQHWKSPSESPMSHVQGGLKLHGHRLYVQTAGIYFVYCQIMYNRAPGDTTEEPHSVLASHYVSRYSLAYPAASGFLLKARHTRVSGRDDRHSSYVGGLFYLHPGDQVYVEVSVPDLVANDDRSSFFGLFRVGQ